MGKKGDMAFRKQEFPHRRQPKGNSQVDGKGRSRDDCQVLGLEDTQSEGSPRSQKALGKPCLRRQNE